MLNESANMNGVDWPGLGLEALMLSAALLLGGAIGVERQFQHKAAGIRTHALVSVGSCLFTVISVNGFADLVDYEFIRDPARIAAQIVSGIGFLGAGVIFVNRDVVRGLTTAASIWLAAAIGMAAGAGMFLIAAFTTVLYFVAVFALGALGKVVPQAGARRTVLITYADGRGILRSVLRRLNDLGCEVSLSSTRQVTVEGAAGVRAQLRVRSGPPLPEVMTQLAEIDGVFTVLRRGMMTECCLMAMAPEILGGATLFCARGGR